MDVKPMVFRTALFMSMFLLLPLVAYPQDHDHERASGGEWIVLLILLAGLVSLTVILPVLWRRNANPHTGLPSKIKRRRGRGPLIKMK
jgi:hypothetical protein